MHSVSLLHRIAWFELTPILILGWLCHNQDKLQGKHLLELSSISVIDRQSDDWIDIINNLYPELHHTAC